MAEWIGTLAGGVYDVSRGREWKNAGYAGTGYGRPCHEYLAARNRYHVESVRLALQAPQASIASQAD
jgi:hypothetical protein